MRSAIRNESIRKKLLTVEDLTFKKAMELYHRVMNQLSAEKNAQQLKGTDIAVAQSRDQL